ncbi:MAG: hypothetical protein GOV15_01785, partial [Candidatus Diapherotrites archaeon]|nr:hypothetical protein [Candidatus Diapherotrites archaeon]
KDLFGVGAAEAFDSFLQDWREGKSKNSDYFSTYYFDHFGDWSNALGLKSKEEKFDFFKRRTDFIARHPDSEFFTAREDHSNERFFKTFKGNVDNLFSALEVIEDRVSESKDKVQEYFDRQLAYKIKPVEHMWHESQWTRVEKEAHDSLLRQRDDYIYTVAHFFNDFLPFVVKDGVFDEAAFKTLFEAAFEHESYLTAADGSNSDANNAFHRAVPFLASEAKSFDELMLLLNKNKEFRGEVFPINKSEGTSFLAAFVLPGVLKTLRDSNVSPKDPRFEEYVTRFMRIPLSSQETHRFFKNHYFDAFDPESLLKNLSFDTERYAEGIGGPAKLGADRVFEMVDSFKGDKLALLDAIG